jgi:hypothetical protein
VVRDKVAGSIKGALEAAAFEDQPVSSVDLLTFACDVVFRAGAQLAEG